MKQALSRSALVSVALAVSILSSCGPAGDHSRAVASVLAKLKPEPTAKAAPNVAFADASGTLHTLAQFRGRYVLLNLWATWCGPCVRELPALGHLQSALGSQGLKVVPVNVGRGTASETASFLKEHRADLPVYMDRKNSFLHAFGAFGLPLSVIIDPQGRQVARALGAVRWDAPESIAYFKSLAKRAPLS